MLLSLLENKYDPNQTINVNYTNNITMNDCNQFNMELTDSPTN